MSLKDLKLKRYSYLNSNYGIFIQQNLNILTYFCITRNKAEKYTPYVYSKPKSISLFMELTK